MVDIRKIIIIFVIAVLFSVLVFSIIEAIYPSPKWEDFCRSPQYVPEKITVQGSSICLQVNVSAADRVSCDQKRGYIEYIDYDSNGCTTNYRCNTCQIEFDAAQQEHSKYVFYISAVLALIAIFIGMYLPAKENSLNEWMGTGFMLGGTFALFFGTAQSFIALDRIVRPIVIFFELVLVIFIAYRKIKNLREDKNTEKKSKKRKK